MIIGERLAGINLRLDPQPLESLPSAMHHLIVPIFWKDSRYRRIMEFAASEDRLEEYFCCAAIALFGRTDIQPGDCRCKEVVRGLEGLKGGRIGVS